MEYKMTWKTYLIMYFGTDSETSITDIVGDVEELGFSSKTGPVDFIYDWADKVPTKEELFELGDKLKKVLKDTGTIFNLDTHE
jgi:hypothetical protein